MAMNDNEKFFIKTRLVNDIISVFSLNAMASEQMKRHSIHVATYNWTEIDGKYQGNRYWSLEALKEYIETKETTNKFIHEHIVPRKNVREKILKLKTIDFQSVYEILEKNLIGAVITKTEDSLLNKLGLRSKMPEELKKPKINIDEFIDNPWGRYLYNNKIAQTPNVEINIVKVIWKGKEPVEVKPFNGLYRREFEEIISTFPVLSALYGSL